MIKKNMIKKISFWGRMDEGKGTHLFQLSHLSTFVDHRIEWKR